MLSLWPIALAYFLGGIPSGLIIAKLFGINDIRQHGSGNIGATNVWRVIGPKAAIWVYLADIGKGAAAVLIAAKFATHTMSIDLFLITVAVAAVLGNLFPVYLGFRGGKGVNTALGTIVVLLPLETLICLLVFVVVVSISRYISLGSIAGGVALVVTLVIETVVTDRNLASVYLYFGCILALLVILSHRQNIRRLIAGTETRMGQSSKPKGAGSIV